MKWPAGSVKEAPVKVFMVSGGGISDTLVWLLYVWCPTHRWSPRVVRGTFFSLVVAVLIVSVLLNVSNVMAKYLRVAGCFSSVVGALIGAIMHP